MGELDLAIGRDIKSGRFIIRSLDQIGSLIICSLTRFGKTTLFQVMIHQIVTRIHPSKVKLAIVDPEEFDYRIWQRVPHLLHPIARTEDEAVYLINLISDEMERRTKLFKSIPDHHICNNLDRYHELIKMLHLDLPDLPRIVFLIDEMDLYAKRGSDLETKLKHLAKRGQKKGVYLWTATQRPTAMTINSDILAEMTARLVGHMESHGDYFRVHNIPKEVYQRMSGKKGRFMFYNEGEWRIIDGAYQPEEKMERAAAAISGGRSVPEWTVIDNNPDRPKRPLKGSNDQKATLVKDWMAGFDRQPTVAEFMAEFDVKSSNTAEKWLRELWN
jgi:hypothetical protein